MKNKVFGYARVSTTEQNLDRQIIQLQEFGIDPRDIYADKKSGIDIINRENYNILKKILRDGDTLVISSLDRLSRNKTQLITELQYFKANNITVRILDIPTTLTSVDTVSAPIINMINTVIIEVLSTMAEQELMTIKKRQREGIDAAKARGKEFGRPRAQYPPLWEMYYAQWRSGAITAKTFMDNLELKRSTFYKLVNRYKEEKGY